MEKRGFEYAVRAAENRRLTGRAAPFDSKTRIADFTEVIKPGAFSSSLGNDIIALQDHDHTKLLGRTKSGTLKLWEKNDGLYFDLIMPDTQAARDVLALAERGDLGGMSFGFTVPDGGESWSGNIRQLVNVNLKEISIVSSWPAYQSTSVNARKKQDKTVYQRRVRLLQLESGLEPSDKEHG